jgi:hypothetical protein
VGAARHRRAGARSHKSPYHRLLANTLSTLPTPNGKGEDWPFTALRLYILAFKCRGGPCTLKKNPAEAGQGEPCYGFESERGVLKYLLIYSIPHCRLGGRGPHAPDDVADIVGDQQTAGPIDRDADRAAECLVVCVDEAGEDIRRLS